MDRMDRMGEREGGGGDAIIGKWGLGVLIYLVSNVRFIRVP